MSTNIQWTDVTDNIIVPEDGGWFCQKISPGCAHCFAEGINLNEFYGGNKRPYTGEPPKLVLKTDILAGWKLQTKTKRHFVASMTDIFGEWLSEKIIFAFLDAMLAAPKQTFQMLTKRDVVALRVISRWLKTRGIRQLPRHMQIGFSAENQELFDERTERLLQIPAAFHFLSIEPMLEQINLRQSPSSADILWRRSHGGSYQPTKIDWIIFGGESGPKARRCDLRWIGDGLDQCREAAIPAFVKQLGANLSDEDLDACATFSGKSMQHPKGGDPSEWLAGLRVREFPV
jgi:protein gp37